MYGIFSKDSNHLEIIYFIVGGPDKYPLDFRKISVIKDACISQVYGLGKKSYLEGLKILNEMD